VNTEKFFFYAPAKARSMTAKYRPQPNIVTQALHVLDVFHPLFRTYSSPHEANRDIQPNGRPAKRGYLLIDSSRLHNTI
jgi:hypothetical protein